MAEESQTGKTTFEDFVLMIFGLMLVSNMFQQVSVYVNEHFATKETSADHVLVATAALTDDTPAGTKVSVPNGAPFYANPDTTEQMGNFLPGTSLVVVEGPDTDSAGLRWWKVRDPRTGEVGWVSEHALVKEGVGGLGPYTRLGTKVRTLMDTILWSAPGMPSEVGRVLKGTWGALTAGPKERNGTRWWLFDNGEGIAGWVPESALTLYSEKGWVVGDRVAAEYSTDLYDRAGGGRIIGALLENEEAFIIGGPTLIGTNYWWFVETKAGVRGWTPEDALRTGGVKGLLYFTKSLFLILGSIVTAVLVGVIVYITIRTNQIRAREAKKIKEAIAKARAPKQNERWEKVRAHVASDNPSEWRLAILEADVMLDEMLTRMGYHGDTLGEKLKQVTRGDMHTLDSAWEAHRARNQIAHEGSDFVLTQREAKRILGLYEAVFREFHYI